jgi:hypothetical protein
MNVNDEMILAAECLLSIINGPFSPSNIEVDIVVKVAMPSHPRQSCHHLVTVKITMI